MKKLSNEFVTKLAVETVILDALAKGHTDLNQMIAYTKSQTFVNAVKAAKKSIKELEKQLDKSVKELFPEKYS